MLECFVCVFLSSQSVNSVTASDFVRYSMEIVAWSFMYQLLYRGTMMTPINSKSYSTLVVMEVPRYHTKNAETVKMLHLA